MLKLILLLCIISIFTKNYENQKINPNTATLEELLTNPNISEDVALSIIYLRETKPFKSLDDLKERLALDSIGVFELEEIFYIENPDKSVINNFRITTQFRDILKYISFYSDVACLCYSKEYDSYYLSYRWISIGKFGISSSLQSPQPSINAITPSYLLGVNYRYFFAFGKNQMFVFIPLSYKRNNLGLSAEMNTLKQKKIILNGKIYAKPLFIYLGLSYPDSTFFFRIAANTRGFTYKGDISLSNNGIFVIYALHKSLTPEDKLYLRLSSSESKNSSYIQYSRRLNRDMFITVQVNPLNSIIPPQLVRFSSKILSIEYAYLPIERVRIYFSKTPISFKLSYYPRYSRFNYSCSYSFSIRDFAFKIDLSKTQINEKDSEYKIELRLNAKKGQNNSTPP